MCGIAGFVGIGQRPVIERSIHAMTAAQRHRGPDDGGVAVIGAGSGMFAALGSRRLAIIDRSAAGRQPLTNARSSAWIVFNGEIYNFAALRTELAGAGYVFQSRTDTEVVLHGYEAWGIEGLLRRLRGMFAFAIWDTHRRRLLLARDRLGEKPLYYALVGGRLLFASELRAIVASRLVECALSAAGTYAYLALGAVPAPLTIADPIRALESGQYAILAGGRLEVTRYWSLEEAASHHLSTSVAKSEAIAHLREVVTQAVSMRTVSEVPAGVFLSGGIDSTAVLAAARSGSSGRLRAHTLIFPEEPGGEAPWARIAAQRFDADLIEHPLTARALADELPRLAAAIDQPSIDGVNTYFAAKFARAAGTIVALSGVGGDELFGGYDSFARVPALMRAGTALRGIAPAGRLLMRLLGYGDGTSRAARLHYYLNGDPSLSRAYFAVRGLLSERVSATLLDRDFWAAGRRQFDIFGYLGSVPRVGTDTASAVSLLELQVYMQNQLLRDTDVMSMAHGVEVRCPLIDHELVEFAAALPAAWKFCGRPKALLLRALGDWIPPELANRRKAGFTLPFASWMRGELSDAISDLLNAYDGVGDVVDKRGALALWAAFQRGRLHWSRIWAVVMLRLWLREFRQPACQPVSNLEQDAAVAAIGIAPIASNP
jgi:asparagine synthase (glutamine-hydrolysing)